ncbi:MAG: ABC transporter permease [Acidimicrobiales bacterium]
MHQFLAYTISGLATSAIYAVAAAGLVLTYTTTGTFNFAQGATSMLGAFAYWQMRFGWHWPAPIALLVCLFVLAPLFGALLDVAVMRRLEGTPETTRLVATISVLVGLLGISLWVWNPNAPRPVRAFFSGHVVTVLGTRVSVDQLITLGIAIAVALGLRLFLYRVRMGVAMRAAVDDRSLARLTGARPDRASMLAWAIGSSLAALSGILIAPTLNVSALPLTLLIINAYAAAVFGRLRSLPLTFVGALILGMSNEYLPDYLRKTHTLFGTGGVGAKYIDGLYLSIPVIVLFIVLIVLPNPRLRGTSTARGREIITLPTYLGAVVFGFTVIVGAYMVAQVLSKSDLENVTKLFGIAIIGLSFVPLVGFAGQISLCQLSFAGIGAVCMAHLGTGGNPVGLLAAAAVAGAVGALISLPALRLQGIYLALATGAFAVTLDRWVFPFPVIKIFGHPFNLFQDGSLTIPRPRFLGLSFNGQKSEFVLLAVGFSLCALLVVWIRRSNFGNRLLAMKDSPAACATLGMNITLTKLAVFTISAAIAGFGGALYGGALRVADAGQFDFFTGLPILLVMVVSGISLVGGALSCGILLGAPFLGNFFPGEPQLTLVLSGTAGIGMARNPNGFIIEIKEAWRPVFARPLIAVGIAAALVGVWLLRINHVISNWPYVVLSLGILLLAPGAAMIGRKAAAPETTTEGEAAVPLEWVGLARPVTAHDVAEANRSLGLPELDPSGAA